MSQQDITIVRRFPIINGFVIIPDYGPDKITLADALMIPGVRLNSLLGNVEIFLETLPGVIGCCGNVPADDISETVKEEVPTPTPTPPTPPTPPEPCDCPLDINTFGQIYLTAQFLDSQGVQVYIPQEDCGCSNSFTGSDRIILSPMARAEDEGYTRCSWVGYTMLQDFRIVISYTSDCRWVITLYCLYDEGFIAIWQGYSNDTALPYGSYTTLNAGPTWCAPIHTAYVSQYQPG